MRAFRRLLSHEMWCRVTTFCHHTCRGNDISCIPYQEDFSDSVTHVFLPVESSSSSLLQILPPFFLFVVVSHDMLCSLSSSLSSRPSIIDHSVFVTSLFYPDSHRVMPDPPLFLICSVFVPDMLFIRSLTQNFALSLSLFLSFPPSNDDPRYR